MRRILSLIIVIAATMPLLSAADPTATSYSYDQCLGSLRPYPVLSDDTAPDRSYPDSLTAVMVNHVGRHGSRFPASARNTVDLLRTLHSADSAGTITPKGRRLMQLAKYVVDTSHNRWGALDSLGMAEERAIASRMFLAFPALFRDTKVEAISSYSPRSVMSMYEFTHQIDRLNNNVEIYTSAGRQNSPLMRFFDVDPGYIEFAAERPWEAVYEMMARTTLPSAPAHRLLGADFQISSEEAQDFSLLAYYVVAGLPAMGEDVDPSEFFTLDEMNSLWSCFNLRQYLRWTITTVSAVPGESASPLLLDIVHSIDSAVEGNPDVPAAKLRFGHAETLMPLLSLMRLQGCYYLTNYFDTVAQHWCDFSIVPMAANLQVVLFRTKKGKFYVRFDLNEKPIPLIPGSEDIYVPWSTARAYLMRCIPLYYQI